MSLKTVTVKCHTMTSSHRALIIIDSVGKQAYIPHQFVLNKKYHEATKEVCEVAMPLWLAIDRGVKYQESVNSVSV